MNTTWPVRSWCVLVAQVSLCAYVRKAFDATKYQTTNPNASLAKTEEARVQFERSQKASQETHDAGVRQYWKEQVLPQLNDHSLVLVKNADKAPAADCFALIRLAGGGSGTKRLLVAQLQMKDYALNSTPEAFEEMAKMGVDVAERLSAKQKAELQPIYERAVGHLQIVRDVFQAEVHFGAVICMSRAEPATGAQPSWNVLTTLQTMLRDNGVMYATPVMQCVFNPKAPE